MRENKAFITLFDVFIIVLTVAFIIVSSLFLSPSGKTVSIAFTVVLDDPDTSALSPGDLLVCCDGGCLGTVSGKGDGYVEVTAEAELHAGVYYSGSVAVCDGREYEICVGADKYGGTVHRISEVKE